MIEATRRVFIGACAAAALSGLAACASMSGAGGVSVRAYSASESAAVLSRQDEYTRELTAADLSIRLQNPQGGSVDDLMALYRRSTLDWTSAEKVRLDALFARTASRVRAIARWLPSEVGVAKASARVEGGFPHTRSNMISLGPSLPATDGELETLFFHELWHVLTRRNARRHDEIYALVGFQPCTSVSLPAGALTFRVTNPDAPVDRHVLAMRDRPGVFLLPRLSAAQERYVEGVTEFGSYFDLRFVMMSRDSAGACRSVSEDFDEASLTPLAALNSIRDAAGSNTTYIFHPEEILADNFAQLMTADSDPPSPDVHERLAAWLGVTREQIAQLRNAAPAR